MRVFITGATGFVGGAVARAFAEDGAEVHALVRSTTDRSALMGTKIIWHEGDILIPASLDGLAGAEWIIHSAGRLGAPGLPEETYHRLHVNGTRNVLAAAAAMRTQPRVLYVSSPGVLGPIAGDPATEDAPLAPSNPYERSKAAAEQVAREYSSRGLPVIIGRPEFIYGPGDQHVLGLYRAIVRGHFFYLAGGRHFCHPTFIADAVAGLRLCLSRGRPGDTYHITGPQAVTFRELGETIASALGARPPRISLPVWLARGAAIGLEAIALLTRRKPPLSRTGVAFFSEDRRFSWEKAHKELGYTPQYDLKGGLSRTVQWYRQQGWL